MNALTSDLNERIDGFILEDLATDDVAGMQALEMREGREIPLHLRPVRDTVRERVPFLAQDAVLSPMIAACDALLNDGPIILEQDTAAWVTGALAERAKILTVYAPSSSLCSL